MKILVTGALGFIGSTFIKWTLAKHPEISIVGHGRMSSQKALTRLDPVNGHERLQLVFGDLEKDCSDLLDGIDVVVNFAAKTFVDHSIKDPDPFIKSNIIGTYKLLEQARKYPIKKFVQVSTDEVYGSIAEGAYREDDRLNPTNPYAAAKAAADMLVISYGNTFGLPYIITRTENNYGVFQHPQKAFPTFVKKALKGEKLPIYGDGRHRRMWLRVEDHCTAILHLIAQDAHGIFHVAGEHELETLELAQRILKCLGLPDDQIEFIPDHNIRPGHDRRYALDVSKLKATGWAPSFDLDTGIPPVVEWYKDNPWWLE